MCCTVVAFMEYLRESELFPSERIDTHWEASRAFLPAESLKPQADARPLADWFVRSAILTSWQARQLLNGCSRGFFLGRYRLLKLLGHGGMSVVYLAFDPVRNSGVALKVLTPRRVRKSSIYDRFRLEAEALCRVRHPNVIRAYALEYGKQGGHGTRSITGSYEMRPHSSRSGVEASLLAEIERQTDLIQTESSSDTLPMLSECSSVGKVPQKTGFSTNALEHTKIADSVGQTDGVGDVGMDFGATSASLEETRDDAEGYWFLVMEYVEGRNLGAMIHDGGPLSIEVATEYLRQAAEGLAAVHAAGFVHRDIKPGNFIVEWTGQIRLLDMGLARFGEETPDGLTPLHADRMFGTADYLAPEQIRNSHIVDGRADLYGLGGTFYAMLTGSPPFPADTVGEKLENQLYMPVPDLRLLRSGVPQRLARLGRKLLAKKPYQRPQSAREVADALRDYLIQYHQTRALNVSIPQKNVSVDKWTAADHSFPNVESTIHAAYEEVANSIPAFPKETFSEPELPLNLSLPDDSPRLLSEISKTQTRVLPRAELIPIALAIPQAIADIPSPETPVEPRPMPSPKTLSEDQVIHFLFDDELSPDADVSEDSEDDAFDPSLFGLDDDGDGAF